jgi:hypothetical protein
MYQANHDNIDGNLCTGGGTVCHVALAIDGIPDGTTIYIRPIAQPSDTSTTDQCSTDVCGAVEVSYTCSVSCSPTYPVLPTAPTTYTPVYPDTSGYTTVPMDNGGASGQCEASMNVGPIGAGDLLQTVIDKAAMAGGQYVIRLPENGGTNPCKLIAPLSLTHFSTTSGCAAWIVIRPAESSVLDFLPDGIQISPLTATHNAVLEADSTSVGYLLVTDGFTTGTQCYWLKHLTVGYSSLAVGGTSGTLAKMDYPGSAHLSDQIVVDQCYFRGRSGQDNTFGIELSTKRFSFQYSYMDNLMRVGAVALGIYGEPGGVGPYNLVGSRYQNVVGETIYNEINNGDTASANNITINQNRFFIDVATAITNGNFMRQILEFKQVLKAQANGNIGDGTFAAGNEGSMMYVAGTNDFQPGVGIADVDFSSNIVTNTSSIMTCEGTRAGSNNPGADMPVTKRVRFSNNLAFNVGINGRLGSGGGTGDVARQITNETGCVDLTVLNNTIVKYSPVDTRSMSTIDFYPAFLYGGGGGVYGNHLTMQKNIFYVSTNATSNDRMFIEDSQTSNSPRLPALNTGGTVVNRLNGYYITLTNAGSSTSYTWDTNLLIPYLTDPSLNNSWVDMNGTQATSACTGIPGGDTCPTNASTSMREGAVGFDSTAYPFACTGTCASMGAGVNLTTLYNTAGIITGIGVPVVLPASATFTYTSPDASHRYVDVSTSSSFTPLTTIRADDGGGSGAHTVTVSGLLPGTTYYWRILNPAGPQVNSGEGAFSFTWPTNQVTAGSLSTPTLTNRRSILFVGGMVGVGGLH